MVDLLAAQPTIAADPVAAAHSSFIMLRSQLERSVRGMTVGSAAARRWMNMHALQRPCPPANLWRCFTIRQRFLASQIALEKGVSCELHRMRSLEEHMNRYLHFKVLLDDPAESPGLGFDSYASALSEIVHNSKAEFAIGIFGTWGSGKTTLMRAINRQLAQDDNVVTAWFTAWRYEKDPHLIVPLLDVLRGALEERADDTSGWAREAAAAVARAGRAFLAGLKLSASIPGFGAELDAGKVIDAIKAEITDGTRPLSFYQSGFLMLRDAIHDLSADGTRCVVIFIDDLDRCLPSNALQVLESMKLFFDVEGCVFVVGLDQDIAERAVAAKYRTLGDANTAEINGTDYVKKIFQVPFALPRISPRQLQDYLSSIEVNADLGDAQRQDFNQNVRRHLRFLPSQDSVNPREVKRLINAYILQLKMLSPRMGESLDPNIVLALQVMSFRPDWRELYDQLATEPHLVQSELAEAVQAAEPPATVWLSGVKLSLPAGLLQYLRTDAEAVLECQDLQSYVSAAESTRHTDPYVREARVMVNRLRRATDELSSGTISVKEASTSIPGDIKRLSEVSSRRSRLTGPELRRIISQLNSIANELQQPAEDESKFAAAWATKATDLFDKLDALLAQSSTSAHDAALFADMLSLPNDGRYPALELDGILIFIGVLFFLTLGVVMWLERRALRHAEVEALKRVYHGLIPLPWLLAAVLLGNGALDHTPPKLKDARVIGKFSMPGPVQSRRLIVTSWREGHRFERVPVDRRDYDRFSTGDVVGVRVQEGLIGIPWVAGVTRP